MREKNKKSKSVNFNIMMKCVAFFANNKLDFHIKKSPKSRNLALSR